MGQGADAVLLAMMCFVYGGWLIVTKEYHGSRKFPVDLSGPPAVRLGQIAVGLGVEALIVGLAGLNACLGLVGLQFMFCALFAPLILEHREESQDLTPPEMRQARPFAALDDPDHPPWPEG